MISASTINATPIIGSAAMATFSIGRPVTPAMTKRHSPTGGVTKPTSTLKTTITPRCTGSIPSVLPIAISAGTVRISTPMVSRNIPRNSRMMFTISRMT